jgi:hypothetical protein
MPRKDLVPRSEKTDDSEDLLAHLDDQIAGLATLIAAGRATGASVDLLKAKETRLRAYQARLRLRRLN